MGVDIAGIIEAAVKIGQDILPILEKIFSSIPW